MANQILEPQLPRRRERVRPEDTCRMFEHELLERFSRIHPATPFVVWIPVATLFLVRSAARHDLAAGEARGVQAIAITTIFVLGVFAWTFAEYVLHRWVFH